MQISLAEKANEGMTSKIIHWNSVYTFCQAQPLVFELKALPPLQPVIKR